MTSVPMPSRRTLTWLFIGLLFIYLLQQLSPILPPFVIAGVLAYICNPLVVSLQKHMPRSPAVLLTIFLIFLLITSLMLVVFPMLFKQGADLFNKLPIIIALVQTKVVSWLAANNIDVSFDFDYESVRQWMTDHGQQTQGILKSVFGQVKVGALALLSLLTTLCLMPVVMYYLLERWPKILHSIDEMIPRAQYKSVTTIFKEVDQVLSEFLRGQITVMLIQAVYYSIALGLVGLNYALPVGVLTGMLSFIPYVGSFLGVTLAFMAAILQGEGWLLLASVAGVYALGQVLESFVLTPYIIGDRIGLHPLAVIFSLMAFGQLFGFVGMLLALPLSAALLVAMRHAKASYLKSSLYLDPAYQEESVIEITPPTVQADI